MNRPARISFVSLGCPKALVDSVRSFNRNEREEAHFRALSHLVQGSRNAAVAVLDSHLMRYPFDIVAHQAAALVDGFLGRFHWVRDRSARALPLWSKDQPGYATMLAFHGFGLEEAGESRSTLAPGTPGLLLTMDDILQQPKHDLVTQFKCIEGWSQIVHWTGVRLADLIAAYPPEKGADGRLPRYVYMETPNGDYYVGYDLEVCLHPQTLLVTEMSGSALTQYHGAPLRLHAPTKYGYKQIKRIGLIAYTDQQPDDYWTKLGYDWYAGL